MDENKDLVVQLKAELYDMNKQLSVLSGVLQQLATLLDARDLQSLYDEVVRLKQFETDTKKEVEA